MTKDIYANKNKSFEFYLLDINKKKANYEEIINVFCDALINTFCYEEGDNTIILSSVSANDMNQIVNAIVEDFGVNIKAFKSNKISSLEQLEVMKELYFKYKDSINENYITVRNLVQIILEKDIKDLDTIKPLILDKIYNDPKLYEIVNGMFVNNLNVCKTANYVYMHRNTINNKLIVIKEETGLDIQNFQDAVVLYVLLKM